MRLRKLCRALVLPVAMLFLTAVGPLPAAQAAMIQTEQVETGNVLDNVPESPDAAADRDRVMSFLARDDVRQQMQDLGVDPEEAEARVAAMSDAEVRELAGKLENAKAGEGPLGAIVGAAVFVFVVLLITDILCFTDVFPFTKCAR
ncbi:MAG: PA2779 family protein [Rhodovibrio sp.]|nr:PA2779 family protein [Rhodovibrio sp.]